MFGLLSASILTASVFSVALLVFYPGVVEGFSSTSVPIKRSPVVLIPGDGGSQLEAKLDKPKTVHAFCDKKTDRYFNLWLNPGLLFPGVVDCWVDNMRLIYNHSSRSTLNSPGVDIRVPGFGNTSSVEWLDPSGFMPPFVRRFILSAYFVDITDMLVQNGYTRGLNIHGAPYDYRKGPNEMDEYFVSLKRLIEESYAVNVDTKVTLICHSMGCPITSYFLSQQSNPWKAKYIKGLIGLSGAWGGAVKALKTIASGENLGIIIVSQTKLRTEQRTGPSLAYMLPSRLVWDQKDVLAMTKEKNYTVENYHEFFRDSNFTTAYEMFIDTHQYAEKGLGPPGVEVHCLHGQGLETPEKLDYTKTNSFPDDPTILNGDGDGTVNTKSLKACLRWRGQQKEKIYYLPLDKLDHMNILNTHTVKQYIKYYVRAW